LVTGEDEGDLVVGLTVAGLVLGALVGRAVGEDEGLDVVGLTNGDMEGLGVGDSLGGKQSVSFATQPILPLTNLQQTGTGLSHAPIAL